ncbi:spermidine synthase [Yinghuangia sp. KLBMP8922]|uniref:Spermidine synthase n=1 Tax=Yinghuangia soli TaxID=2908204 RepID=A0AA41PTU5_9ACTN|nr:spermidine synthase [Yinghuangia soli]MCF2525760.1 spermidine synthase [Yinghuangia soli]
MTSTVVDRVATANGELVLRRDGAHFEIISNGTFLMDTRDGTSERLLVRAAVAALPGTGLRVLVGGLGVGFSLGEAAAHPAVGHVTVVEREAPVIAWQRGPLAPFSGHALYDPKVEVRQADLVAWAHDSGASGGHEAVETFDALCLDIDNGPDWTVTDSNRSLYGEAGLRALRRRLAPGGVLAVWSAAASPEFEKRLGTVFARVQVEEIPVRVPRGVPDVVYLAS